MRKKAALAPARETLYRGVRAILESARSSAYRAVNAAMVQAYWQIGRLIVEHEQGGRKRAAYGDALLDDLSRRLTADFGRGFTTTNLKYMRSFYLAFRIRHALRDEFTVPAKVSSRRAVSGKARKRNAVRSKLPIRHSLRPELSWTHYRLLLSVEDHHAREWYLRESADQHWSTRQLERQISALYYERLLASRDRSGCGSMTRISTWTSSSTTT